MDRSVATGKTSDSSVGRRVTPSEDESRFVCLGFIARAHGVRGELSIALANPDSETLISAKNIWLKTQSGFYKYSILSTRQTQQKLLLSLEGINDRDTAMALHGKKIFFPKELLPPPEEDEIYFYQLEGLPVETTKGESLGKISSIVETRANAILLVSGPKGEYLLPFIDDVIQEIDLEKGLVTIELLEGLEPS